MRRSISAVVAALLAVAVIVAALPFVASTRIVRDRIAYEMSVWSGFRVDLGDGPDIEVWPSFRAVLHDVSFFEWGNADAGPVIEVETMEVDLSALAALRGDIEFSKVELFRPVLRVTQREGDGVEAAAAAGGRIALAVATARRALAANPADPDTSSLPSGSFGTVEFSEGIIEIANGGGAKETVEGVAGTFSWPQLDRPATLSASGLWRQEAVTVSISSEEPLMLLAGGNAPLGFSFKSEPLNASFKGVANLSRSHFVDGAIELASPSLARALEWLHTEIAPGAAVGPMSVSGQVTGRDDRFKLVEARLALGEKAGVGGLEFSLADRVPSLSGTLAFDSIDLLSFLSAFTMLPPTEDSSSTGIDTSFIHQMKLDLRLSAAEATAGAIELTDVAATAQVTEGLVAFDISDATAFSGTLQAGFRLSGYWPSRQGEFRLLANEIDSAALASAAGAKQFAAKGPATVSVLLKGDAQDWQSLFEKAEGTISARFGPGSISGFDLSAFLERCAQGGFFALGDVAQGAIDIEAAELKATVAKGTARIEKAEAKAGPRTISLSGIIPYVGRGLALSGTISPGASENSPNSGVAFFVGGPWSAPFISPIVTVAPVQEW